MVAQYIPSAPGDATHAVAITPSDTTVYSPPLSQLYLPVTGAVAVLLSGDTVPVTLATAAAGMLSGFLIQKVMATGTTPSTNIVGFR